MDGVDVVVRSESAPLLQQVGRGDS
jgi:hypothetical protein